MANTLEIATFEQIAIILSKLMTNYNVLADNYYKIFYDTTPADITITLYNEEGELTSYTLPNRAKDFNYIKNGNGSPEGVVVGAVGTLYQDLTNGVLYIKELGTGRTGWVAVPINTNIEEGNGSPEGNLTRAKGTIYVDKSTASMYIKSTNSGNTGWNLIAIDASNFANTDLSNLTSIGESHFANPSLSNLNAYGQAMFDEKASIDLDNLSEEGQMKFNKKASIDLDNLSEEGQMKFIELEEAVNQRATQSLINLTDAGNAKFQYAPFSINGGSVGANGDNVTLYASGGSVIDVNYYVIPLGLSSNSSNYGECNDYKLTGSASSVGYWRQCTNPFTMSLNENYYIPADVDVTFTIETQNNAQQIEEYGNLYYRTQGCIGCQITYTYQDDSTEVILDEKNTGNFLGWNSRGSHKAEITLPRVNKVVKGVSVQLYAGNLGLYPVWSGVSNAWGISFKAEGVVSSADTVICNPCVITSSDGKTGIFNTESILKCSDVAEGDYKIMKSVTDGSLSLANNIFIQKKAPTSPEAGDYWLNTSQYPLVLQQYVSSNWVTSSNLVYIGDLSVGQTGITVTNNIFNQYFKQFVSVASLPSDTFKSISLQSIALPYSFIAPADGYFVVDVELSESGSKYVKLYNTTNHLGNCATWDTTAGGNWYSFVPAKKGDEVYLDCNATLAKVNNFGFVTTEGEVQ